MICNSFKFRFLLFVNALLVWIIPTILGQMEYPGYPEGLRGNDKGLVKYYELPSAEVLYNQFNENTKDTSKVLKKDIFAEAVEVMISPSDHGHWYTGENKCRIWQLGITAGSASSINLIFKPFNLSPGCRLFVYTPDMEVIYGAFTFRNNRKSKVFAITPLPGDSLIIELQVDNQVKNIGELVLSKAGVGFPGKGLLKDTEDKYYGWSEACNVDVNCKLSENIQRQKYSVCRIIYDGTARCTGTLVNNTKEDGKPLILTAGHCIMNENSAESALYYFDYESPYCEGPDGQLKSISGSTLLSQSHSLDFSLMEIFERPSADYLPYYAGWDIREMDFDSVYILHHPEGDVKKISTYNDFLLSGTFYPYDSESHWLIPKYDTGTSENGSSGAALFNSSNRIIGSLTGGGRACTEFIYDYYQMLHRCWADYPLEDEQLKVWLDPSNSGVSVLDNFAPVDPLFSVSEELSNSSVEEKDTVIKNNGGWGYISGHNHLQKTEYAEYFSMNGTKYLYALNIKISKLHFTQLDSKIKIKVWNNRAYPNDLIYEKELYYFEMIKDQENFIRLDTILYVDKGFFIGYEIYYTYPSDTFAVFTKIPDTNSNNNTAFYRNSGQWFPLTDGVSNYNTSLMIKALVMNYYPPDKSHPENFPVDEVTLYPNPTYVNLQVLFKSDISEDVELKVYDLSGKLVLKETRQSSEPNFVLNTGFLSQGIYILKIAYSGGTSTLKFVKL